MSSPLTQAGAISPPSAYAPLHVNRYFSGLWTQRSKLREAAVPFLYEKFYAGARFDSMLDGLNMEISSRLTIVNRPGLSVYNSQIFPAVNRFYEFRTFNADTEVIRVMADCVANVYDATGPNTKNNIWTKSAGAGSSYFQSVGNTLYFGNGVDRKKWLQSAKTWQPNFLFKSGDFIVDEANNLQIAMGARTLNATNVSIVGNVLTITFRSRAQLVFFAGMQIGLQNFVNYAFLNGQTVTITSMTYNQIVAAFVHANVSGADSGTAATALAGGLTGGAEPVWGNTKGAITIDGNQQWLCGGSSIQNYGANTPAGSPNVANAPRPGVYNNWTANTYYNSSLTIIDSNGNLQLLVTGGQTGAGAPVWSVVVGGITNDNTAQWKMLGSAARANAHAYVVGDQVQVTWTYWITIPGSTPPCFSPNVPVMTPDGAIEFGKMPSEILVMTEAGPMMADLLSHEFDGIMIDMGDGQLITFDHLLKREGGYIRAAEALPDNPRVRYTGLVYNLAIRTDKEELRHYLLENGETAHNMKAPPDPDDPPPPDESYEVTATAVWQCIVAGNSAASDPGTWVDALGATAQDGDVTWKNTGAGVTWATIGANTLVSLDTIILDSNGNKQQIQTPGKSSAVHPTWSATVGVTTIDNAATWICQGQFSGANTGQWVYAYAFRNSVSGHVGTASPLSLAITLAANKIISVQGQGDSDAQTDVIDIYRTKQNGPTTLLFLLDQIPNPGNATWSYNDSTTDDNLAITIQAAINSINNAPPDGIVRLNYHLGRVWGAVGNTLYYSAGPDTIIGVGNESFPPLNTFIYPSKIIRTWSTAIGLIVFTVSDTYIVLGRGTSDSTFYTTSYLKGIGILSYDAFDEHGSTGYILSNVGKFLSIDPGAGVLEPGFPIGDQFQELYDPSTAFVTWHEGGSTDTACYVADGSDGWFRLSPTSAPETGFMWSPRAVITGGCKAVQSVEVEPGIVKLLVGPGAGTGPIEMRDLNTNSDNLTPFAQYITIGNIVLAQPGSQADLEFITLESVKSGKRPTIGVLLGELSGTFETVKRSRQDPPLLPPSKTIYNDRYALSQHGTATLCRNFQLKVSYPTEDAAHELLTHTIYGAVIAERAK